MASTTVKWEKLNIKDSSGMPVKGIELRDYGSDGRSYRIREMLDGKPYLDSLVGLSLEEVLIVRKTLHENRVNGAGPQTYKEMVEAKGQTAQLAAIEKDKEAKATIAQAYKAKNSTIAKYYEETYWPERQKRRGSHNQNRTVDGHFRNWIKPLVGDLPFAEFTYKDIDRITQAMREKGKSETTIKHTVDTLANIWNRAMEDELVVKPFPRGKAEKIYVDNEKTCFLTRDEADVLLATVKTWQPQSSLIQERTLYGFCVLSLFAGLRCSEIESLTWQNIAAGKVTKTKNKKARAVHFDIPEIMEMLNERRSMFPNRQAHDFVFPEQPGNVAIAKEFGKVVDLLGFNQALHRIDNPREKINFHALRHTFASWLAMAGTPLFDIMVLLGHSSLNMVKRYAALSPEYTHKAVMALSRKKEAAIMNEENRRFLEEHQEQFIQ